MQRISSIEDKITHRQRGEAAKMTEEGAQALAPPRFEPSGTRWPSGEGPPRRHRSKFASKSTPCSPSPRLRAPGDARAAAVLGEAALCEPGHGPACRGLSQTRRWPVRAMSMTSPQAHATGWPRRRRHGPRRNQAPRPAWQPRACPASYQETRTTSSSTGRGKPSLR